MKSFRIRFTLLIKSLNIVKLNGEKKKISANGLNIYF